MRDFISIVSVLTLLSGCWAMALGTLEISEPYLQDNDSKSPLKNGVVFLEGVSIAVVPINYRRSGETAGPLFFPVIPVGSDSRFEGQGKHFRVVVELEPSASGVTFDPSRVELFVGSATFRPEWVGGPYGGQYPRVAQQRAIPGHAKWECSYAHYAPLSTEMKATAQVSRIVCFAMIFSVDTPSPSQQFSFRVRGIQRNGIDVETPIFHFRPSSATYTYRVL